MILSIVPSKIWQSGSDTAIYMCITFVKKDSSFCCSPKSSMRNQQLQWYYQLIWKAWSIVSQDFFYSRNLTRLCKWHDFNILWSYDHVFKSSWSIIIYNKLISMATTTLISILAIIVGRSMKVVVDQSSEAEEINTSVHHGSILGTSLFLFFFLLRVYPGTLSDL